jgi:hypothetical protein
MSLFTIDDLNGDHYLGLQEGETLVRTDANVYVFPFDFPSAQEPQENVSISVAEMKAFCYCNYNYLKSIQESGQVLYNDHDAAIITLHRMLAVKHGLVSPHFRPADNYVDYSEAWQLDEEQTSKLILDVDFNSKVTVEEKKHLMASFVDRVSLVAFVFRARGHHYMDTYDELYTRVWQKCRYNLGHLHITFKNLATAALHAIFPCILDAFWVEEVSRSHVNGAIAKRMDCAVAGMAGPNVLKQGITDILMVAPGLEGRFQEPLVYLDEVLVKLAAHRFAGSVNSRYYGAPKVRFDEKRLSAIAAIISAALDALTEDAPLAKSAALKRIANNAPITGAVLGRAIAVLPNRPEVINNLLIAPDAT